MAPIILFIGTHCSELQYYSPLKCKCTHSWCKGPTFSFKFNLPNCEGFPTHLSLSPLPFLQLSRLFQLSFDAPTPPLGLYLFSLSIHCFFIFMSHPGSETWPQTAWIHLEWFCLKCNLSLFLTWTGWSIEMFLVISNAYSQVVLSWALESFLYSDHLTLNLPLILLSSVLESGESFYWYLLKTPLFIHSPFYFLNWPQD